MRLRTRLALAFALLAVAPLALVVPFALSNLRATLSGELQGRMNGAESAARTALSLTSDDVKRSVDELSASMALEDVAKDLHAGSSPSRVATAGERLMRSRGLTVLSLFDARGVTVSSGHLPARLGDQDPALFEVTRKPAGEPVPVSVEIRDESGLKKMPALVAARSMDYGDLRVWVVGGMLLDQALANHLANLTGARAEILTPAGIVAAAGSAEPDALERTIELGPSARVRLLFSQSAFLKAERGVARAFGALVAVGFSCAVLLGLFVSRRITRPVEALTAAAREVAQGRLDVKVEARASSEVGELVGAFNRMTGELKETTERLVASERVAAWQEVARRLAHEIKNPLTPIKMSLETLVAAQRQENPRFQALFQESAGAVLEEVERLRRIVDEFSRFARLPKPRLEPVELADWVAQVTPLFGTAPGVRVEVDVPRGVRVEADRDQLTQVLVNLVKNAQEAMPEGGRIRIAGERRDGWAALSVEDSGPGIPAEDRTRIFEPYFTTKSGGTGLGLAIAARICQEHGGRLEAGGTYGKGAVFTILLPTDAAASRSA